MTLIIVGAVLIITAIGVGHYLRHVRRQMVGVSRHRARLGDKG